MSNRDKCELLGSGGDEHFKGEENLGLENFYKKNRQEGTIEGTSLGLY